MINDIATYLQGNAYPGRGIIVGRSADGEQAYVLYFIMGRSANSRNRVFAYTEDGIRTKACDPSKMKDPSLVIYHPVRFCGRCLVVTNGDQTDTVRDALAAGGSFREALDSREFEPDAPNYTPRISAIVEADGSYQLSILKSLDGDPSCCCRYTFSYDKPKNGLGHIVHTYEGDGNPLPSFLGEPRPVGISGTLEEYANLVWDALNADNKVSLYACAVDLVHGGKSSLILNKYQEVE
ncbi:MAG: IMP cyclohydrolase [Firmicutes bacterium]|nr:IMP cyclohydrolase [Bacillota bacterium]